MGGQKLECSQLGAMVTFQGLRNVLTWNTGRQRDDGRPPMKDNALLSYYKCGDGKWLTVAPCLAPAHWPKFCAAMGLERLLTDTKTAKMEDRQRNVSYFRQQLEAQFEGKARDQWIDVLVKAGVPVGPILTY